jgi:methylenetetrahydrofolate reductase (NADPH)
VGIHIGGIHRDFAVVARILDRMETSKADWQQFVPQFDYPQADGFYAFPKSMSEQVPAPAIGLQVEPLPVRDRVLYPLMKHAHRLFFTRNARLAGLYRTLCRLMDRGIGGRLFLHLAEHPVKRMLLGCVQCGDCAIQHVGFLCPESGCPKHTRNGACGGSSYGMCEVNPDRRCVWYRAHNRLAADGQIKALCDGCVPPRMWELNQTSSWLNFHLQRDHQSNGGEIAGFCRQATCRLLPEE